MIEALGSVSPFICGKMIKNPEKFWGRKSEVQQIFSHLRKLESISIIGERRIGKSSLAYNIFSTYKENLGDKYQIVWLDGQSNKLSSLNSFFSHISSQGAFEYISGTDHNECLVNFENAIQNACRNNNKKIVLVINEFELLTDSAHQIDFNENFFLTLRLLADQENFAIITTSKKPLVELCMHVLPVSSPFYNVFIQIPLSSFSDQDANEFLIKEHDGFKLTQTETDFIRGIPYYQHPLRLQVACHYVFINRQLNLSISEVKKQIISKTELLMSHSEVEKERIMPRTIKKDETKESSTRNRIAELIAAILVPVLSIALFIGALTLALQFLDNIQAVLVALLSSIIGFAVMLFAARFIGVINEATFSKLFGQIIGKISLLSRETKDKEK